MKNDENKILIEQDNDNDFLVESKFKKQIDELNRHKKIKNETNKTKIDLFNNGLTLIKKDKPKEKKSFNLIRTLKVFLYILFVFSIFLVIINFLVNQKELASFHAVSLKPYEKYNYKETSIFNSLEFIKEKNDKNKLIKPDNLNFINIYKEVLDEDDKRFASKDDIPVPTENPSDLNTVRAEESVFEQVYEKLKYKYISYINSLYAMISQNPVNVVREYHFKGSSILGSYNPQDRTHVKGKRSTYFIKNYSNVKIDFIDADGNPLEEGNNIKDIMSMASVYSYYHDYQDADTYLKMCYELFDHSYAHVASLSNVYYCSGCMNYDAEDKEVHPVTLDKINLNHVEQKMPIKIQQANKGRLIRLEDTHEVNISTYDDYVNELFNGNNPNTLYNYCPGHVDLHLTVVFRTIDNINSLYNADISFGNRGKNYNSNWHGWDINKKALVRKLASTDWLVNYGVETSNLIDFHPLTQEEINFYLNRLDRNLTKNRFELIKTALQSVSRIPYYYGGKSRISGYEKNNFGTKIRPDYKGRSLKGLDCSGWINWVYLTAFNKNIIKSEGTAKLSTEGTKITREDLMPGDILVRPGYDSHVMMFLEWCDDNKIKVIHENGAVNNISIGTYDAYYPYYRRIITS